MRFSGSRAIAAPPQAVWQALHQPDALEAIIPDCTRIERQPGYQPERAGDFALSFEVGRPNVSTGAEPIIGWLEVDRQRAPQHLALTLTLNDALYFMRIEGTIDLEARSHGSATFLRYACDADLPQMRGIGWSAEAHAMSERIITKALDRLERVTAGALVTAASGAPSAGRATRPQVLAETARGNVVLLPATEVPTPTQSMLRRLTQAQVRRLARQQRAIAVAVTGTFATFAISAVIWRLLVRPKGHANND
jgi:hypothetical protein